MIFDIILKMGNENCCSTRPKGKSDLFDKNELMILNEFLEYYGNQFVE